MEVDIRWVCRHVIWVFLTNLGKSHLIEIRKQVQPRSDGNLGRVAGRVTNTIIEDKKVRPRSDPCADMSNRSIRLIVGKSSD